MQYQDENTRDNEDTYLLQVRGVSKYDTKAVQVNTLDGYSILREESRDERR